MNNFELCKQEDTKQSCHAKFGGSILSTFAKGSLRGFTNLQMKALVLNKGSLKYMYSSRNKAHSVLAVGPTIFACQGPSLVFLPGKESVVLQFTHFNSKLRGASCFIKKYSLHIVCSSIGGVELNAQSFPTLRPVVLFESLSNPFVPKKSIAAFCIVWCNHSVKLLSSRRNAEVLVLAPVCAWPEQFLLFFYSFLWRFSSFEVLWLLACSTIAWSIFSKYNFDWPQVLPFLGATNLECVKRQDCIKNLHSGLRGKPQWLVFFVSLIARHALL